MYWVLGTWDSDFDQLALTASLLRAGESLGSTCSYGVGASSSTSLMVNLIVAVVVWFVAAPATTYSAWVVPDLPSQPLYVEDPATSGDEEDRDIKNGGFATSTAVV